MNLILKLTRTDRRILVDIFLSFVFRGSSAVCAFLLVPITLGYLDKDLFGLWMTILAFLNWSNVFDLGINNGLKTKLIYAFSQNDMELARREISTTYNLMFVFSASLLTLVLVASQFINWNHLFNYDINLNLRLIIVLPLLFFLLKLYTDLIYAVLLARQKTGVFNFLYFLMNLLSLAVVYLISKNNIEHRLLAVAVSLSAIPFLTSLIANVYFFTTTYKHLKPGFLKIDKSLLAPTLTQGLRFFVIQLSVLVIFSTDNLIIIRLFSPSDVTVYNICYKFFSVFTIIWTVLITPFWSAFGDAFHKNDIQWIRKTIRKLIRLWWLLNLALLITLLFIDSIYHVWVGSSIKVPYSLSIFTALFVSIFSLANIYIYFINGIGKIQVILLVSIIVGIINIPVAILLAKYMGLGLTGIMISTCVCLLANPVVGYIQYRKLITKQATGIWFK